MKLSDKQFRAMSTKLKPIVKKAVKKYAKPVSEFEKFTKIDLSGIISKALVGAFIDERRVRFPKSKY